VGWDKDSITEQQREINITTILLIKTKYKAQDAQCSFAQCLMAGPLPNSDPPPPASSTSYILRMTSYGIKYPVWLVWVSHPGYVPSQLPVKITSILAKTRTCYLENI